MADCLREWLAAEACGAPHFVESPAEIVRRLRLRRALRHLSLADAASVREASALLGVGIRKMRELAAHATPQALIESHAPDNPDPSCQCPVGEAIALLEDMVESLDGVRDAA
ncbi:hypothetical protein [Aurantimonas sp. VKM B-3413]|uniref:hypothetical protein n=1 Tax=Aurantimonas sp. VKM B-3413 TaxID=2779401 RepID=UPI001E445AB0|nr:hypothetical protein [Aurantimonas sp. VKM B-3413]MCB8837965.1 hypothetical protein [Aurantimonas sp. VKM B-3413]